ncbi:3D domain-containing protein [Clostridium oryzae]|uniref:Cell wall-binding protein YocH n=1 Tax=Clostridium oryzae TaxID=1450648 RepID=A0A1V4IN32_9CLOT|nr:3D domain-containing protein [Clostridium oryzae]OPJ61293.1 cell wall-binding protein YocH precursor [Clostridium oryzae]
MERLKRMMVKRLSHKNSIFLVLIMILLCYIVLLSMKKTLIVSINDHQKSIVTYSSNLRSSLEKNNIKIGPKDRIYPALKSKIRDGQKIVIKKAVNVYLTVDGSTRKILTSQDNIGDMLLDEGITINKSDKVAPSLDTLIKKGEKIQIKRVTKKTVRQVKKIEYSTIVKKDAQLPSNFMKILRKGHNGRKQITVKQVYEDGKLVSSRVSSNKILKKSKNKVILKGSKNCYYLASRGGSQLTYTRVFHVRATAYSACYECTGKTPGDKGYGITACGTVAKRNVKGYSTIAVDPRIIPLGTKVFVKGYGFAIAEDVGGAIKGNRIDLFFNSYGEAINWGVKYIELYVMK